MPIEYQYYGNVTGHVSGNYPSGIVRTWTGPDGELQEEVYTKA